MPNERRAWLITALAVLVVAAAFMPWAQIGVPAQQSVFLPRTEIAAHQTVTGWNGTMLFLGMVCPNWAVLVAAVALAIVSWLIVADMFEEPFLLRSGLALYGLGYSCWFALLVLGDKDSRIGLGNVLTCIAFAIDWFLVRRERNEAL